MLPGITYTHLINTYEIFNWIKCIPNIKFFHISASEKFASTFSFSSKSAVSKFVQLLFVLFVLFVIGSRFIGNVVFLHFTPPFVSTKSFAPLPSSISDSTIFKRSCTFVIVSSNLPVFHVCITVLTNDSTLHLFPLWSFSTIACRLLQTPRSRRLVYGDLGTWWIREILYLVCK